MSDPTINIGLLWHAFDSGNHGVNALTVSNRAIAAAAAREAGLEPRFTIFAPGAGTARETNADGDAIVRINRRTLITSREYWSEVAKLDCMLDISAGDSFADIYGAKRFFWMWATKRAALLRRVPLVLSPQTIGPFTRQPYKQLAGAIMTRAELTIARDPLSYEAIGSLAPRARRMLSADVAFRLPFTARAKAKDRKTHVGVNVSGLLWTQSGGGGNAYGLSYDYAAMMLQVLDALAARKDVVTHLITHVVAPDRPADNDAWIVDELAARYPGAIRAPDFAGPSEAKSYISGLDLLMAARMHACIAAFSSGVPVLPLAYSRKFTGLFDELLGYGHTLTQTGHTAESAAAFILDRIDRREELAAAVAAGNARVAPLLDAYSDALKQLFVRVAGARR
jgi:polysaccharide pyruvyl transferase WcaK-like protein